MLWLKYMTDVIATFGVGFLAGAAHMTDEEWGKILMIATAMSWFIWFLILYLHRNLRKNWLWQKRGKMKISTFICCTGIMFLMQYLSVALLAGIEFLLKSQGIGLNGQSEYLDQLSFVAVVSACLIAPFFEEVLFRGGVLEQGDYLLLIREDGTLEDLGITVTTNNGTVIENGEVIDPMEPSASTILELMAGPQLTHKGNWIGWCFGVAICLLAVASILFADELFRFNLSFQIRNVADAEPSDWEIAQRYILWTVLPIGALAVFIWGLR